MHFRKDFLFHPEVCFKHYSFRYIPLKCVLTEIVVKVDHIHEAK